MLATANCSTKGVPVNTLIPQTAAKIRAAYFFAFLSSIFAIGGALSDAYISRNIITAPQPADKMAAACAYLTLGGIVGSIIFIALACTPFGRVLDPKHRKLGLGSACFQAHSALSGSLSAIVTGIYLFAFQQGHSAATLVALSASRILWTIAYEHVRSADRVFPKVFVLPACLMVAGVWIGEGLSNVTLEVFLLIFVLSGCIGGISEVHDKLAAREAGATMATVWRFIYLGASGTLLSAFYVWNAEKMTPYVNLLLEGFRRAMPAILILMTFNFLANGWSSRAKAELGDMGASAVILVSNLRIVGVLVALGIIQYVFGTDAFGLLPSDTPLLVRKVISALVITVSVMLLLTKSGQKE